MTSHSGKYCLSNLAFADSINKLSCNPFPPVTPTKTETVIYIAKHTQGVWNKDGLHGPEF